MNISILYLRNLFRKKLLAKHLNFDMNVFTASSIAKYGKKWASKK